MTGFIYSDSIEKQLIIVSKVGWAMPTLQVISFF